MEYNIEVLMSCSISLTFASYLLYMEISSMVLIFLFLQLVMV
ncbi:hypothetical protein T01_3282 [Trichinella spiralis]|uniref:Uncharacterized protein n=1 Tax=Trichinella spiralis TaxID=6334 RepID=A0A0V0YQT6_TRISP|nr:hypothetical protein T01_3282 [Trichinella spiralis]